jgi:hypothetical protein
LNKIRSSIGIAFSVLVLALSYAPCTSAAGYSGVQFVTAADSATAGATIATNGTYASFSSMTGWPGVTRTYQAAVGIQNSNTSTQTIELRFNQSGDWSGDTGNIDSLTVIVRDNAGGTQQGNTINVGTAGSTTGNLTIPGGTTWVVEWNIKWKAGALSTDSVSALLTLYLAGTAPTVIKPPIPVGGELLTPNRLELMAPYLALAVLIAAAAGILIKKRA